MSRNDPQLARTGALARSVRSRRGGLRALFGIGRISDGVSDSAAVLGLLVVLFFAVAATALAAWTRTRPLVAPGRVMHDTRVVRVEQLATIDEVQTRQARDAARLRTPRVYVADEAALAEVVASIRRLPETVEGAASASDVDPAIREQFGLTQQVLEAVREAGRNDSAWTSAVSELNNLLRRRPLLDAQTYQRAMQEGTHTAVSLRDSTGWADEVYRGDLINLADTERVVMAMRSIARDAGFAPAVRGAVVARLVRLERPTYAFDAAATAAAQSAAVAEVPPVRVRIPRGEVIYRRGEPLTQSQAALVAEEMRAYDGGRTWLDRAVEWGSLLAVSLGVSAALAAYATLFVPVLRKRAARAFGMALLLLAGLALACVGAALAPAFLAVFVALPSACAALLTIVGYGRRAGLAFGLMHGLLVCLALDQGLGALCVAVAGVLCVAATLREVRDRRSLVRTSAAGGLGIAAATVVMGLLTRATELHPLDVLQELATDAVLCGAGMMVAGAVTLFTLPAIERAFGVTTGLTLSDMRDPKQPLLRELQMRAPGTYTHSLNVASLAEAAAESIGGDGLLAYVGALYHDVGKMNKPEYFVENQAGSASRHDKLSPAMSLLIVVGHVKDGMELAREFRLPMNVRHFIESHHGTTLVEYFYHRARRQAFATAQLDEDPEELLPDEFAYRYPGPKPRTKEAAILMIADACESATRALGEPTPSKIDSLVREISDRRLRDGQFDDCNLTLRELSTIVDSVSRTLTSMHHARIAYPTPQGAEAEEKAAAARA